MDNYIAKVDYEDIVYTLDNLKDNYRVRNYFNGINVDISDIKVKNEAITRVQIGALQQYRNRLGLEIAGENFYLVSWSQPVEPYIGALLQFFASFFESSKNFFEPKDIEGQYIRVLSYKMKIIGFGHITKDQFVFLDDIVGKNSKLWRE